MSDDSDTESIATTCLYQLADIDEYTIDDTEISSLSPYAKEWRPARKPRDIGVSAWHMLVRMNSDYIYEWAIHLPPEIIIQKKFKNMTKLKKFTTPAGKVSRRAVMNYFAKYVNDIVPGADHSDIIWLGNKCRDKRIF